MRMRRNIQVKCWMHRKSSLSTERSVIVGVAWKQDWPIHYVWRHMTCAQVIFEACHDLNICYLFFCTFTQKWSWCRWCWKRDLLDCCWCSLFVLDIVLKNSYNFQFPLSCKRGGIVMACRTLTKTHFTSEQSLSFPLWVPCSVRKLGRTNKFSAPSL